MLDRDRVGRSRGLRFHQFVHASLAGILGFGAVPLRKLPLLCRRQHRQTRNLLLWIGDNRFQHRLEMSRHACDGRVHQTDRCSRQSGPEQPRAGRPVRDQDRTWPCRSRDRAGSGPSRVRKLASAAPAKTSPGTADCGSYRGAPRVLRPAAQTEHRRARARPA